MGRGIHEHDMTCCIGGTQLAPPLSMTYLNLGDVIKQPKLGRIRRYPLRRCLNQAKRVTPKTEIKNFNDFPNQQVNLEYAFFDFKFFMKSTQKERERERLIRNLTFINILV